MILRRVDSMMYPRLPTIVRTQHVAQHYHFFPNKWDAVCSPSLQWYVDFFMVNDDVEPKFQNLVDKKNEVFFRFGDLYVVLLTWFPINSLVSEFPFSCILSYHHLPLCTVGRTRTCLFVYFSITQNTFSAKLFSADGKEKTRGLSYQALRRGP